MLTKPQQQKVPKSSVRGRPASLVSQVFAQRFAAASGVDATPGACLWRPHPLFLPPFAPAPLQPRWIRRTSPGTLDPVRFPKKRATQKSRKATKKRKMRNLQRYVKLIDMIIITDISVCLGSGSHVIHGITRMIHNTNKDCMKDFIRIARRLS